jgi:alkylation response protein AidB-like acyl-CoA dehydrogenase
MDLELSDEQRELRDGVRRVLEEQCPPALPRAVHERGETGAALWRQMVELAWPGVAIAEAQGGLGLGAVELCLVAEELGRAVAPGPFLATATQYAPLLQEAGSSALAHDPGPALAHDRLARVAAGALTGTVALAEDERWELDRIACRARLAGGGFVLAGRKTGVFDGATADEIAVVARGEAGLGVFLVPGGAAKAEPRTLLDPTIALADLALEDVAVPAERVLLAPGAEAERAVARALEVATVALSLATAGACRRIFELTLEYAKVRRQYDRPIGSFQALKHRLADMYLAVERATALGYYAALTLAEDDPRRHEAASLAKAEAGACQRLLVEEGLQLHGGIGFTWEHDLHLWLKRAKAGDALLGDATEHRARLARRLGLAAA